jgi:hypothetical protein
MLAVAVLIVVFMTSVTFGILLSSSSQDAQAMQETETAVSLVRDAPTLTITPRSVPSRTVNPSRTPIPTEPSTAMETESVSIMEESVTMTLTPRSTVAPSRTRIIRSESATMIPTITPTSTLRRPTVTSTPTATITLTLTPSRTPSVTMTATPSRTPIVILGVSDLGIVETPTLEATLTLTPCIAPSGWALYEVERGVTLFMVALDVGVSVVELQAANCITDVDRIIAGSSIYVPRLPDIALETGRLPQGCQNVNVSIRQPQPNQRLDRVFHVMGSASIPDFGYYKLEIRAEEATRYNFLMQSSEVVLEGVLGRVDVDLFPPGRYWLRLAVVDASGNIAPDSTCVIPMIFE